MSDNTTRGPTYDLHAVAVHLALLRTGKAVLFSGSHEKIWDWTKGESSMWDPQDPSAHADPELQRNLFCSGHCMLPDGRLLVAGGQSTFNHPATIILSVLNVLPLALKMLGKEAADHDIHTFDPADQKWRRHGKMPRARWYPTCVTLPDGKALIVSGTRAHAYHAIFGGFINLDYEIFDPATNLLSKPERFVDKIDLYPFLHVLPGGTLFVHSEDTTTFWNIAQRRLLSGSEFHNRSEGTRTYPGMGSCVLLPLEHDASTAKIMVVGGSTKLSPNNQTDATDVSEIFTVNLADPDGSQGWEKIVASSPYRRFLCDSVLLPDGKVLVTNGARKGVADDNREAVMEIELFDPTSSSWTMIGTLQRPRLYHSSAMLLPDGKVLVAGSTGHSWLWASASPDRHFEHQVEIVVPPYLFGSPQRPAVQSAPASIRYGSTFDIVVGGGSDAAADIAKVSLVRLSSTTHNNNMDQRCLMLQILGRSGSTLTLAGPKDGSWAPPGYYMLFLVSGSSGAPSVGRIVSVHA